MLSTAGFATRMTPDASASVIPAEIYDDEYFLSDLCEGWEHFRCDRGLSVIKRRELELLDVFPGADVLDAGCGRGELLLACAEAGARIAGIDYSSAAIELTKQTLAGVDDFDVRHGDVTDLPWADASFDRVLLGDVIEHLTHAQAAVALRELHRVLRPGGLLVVHTAPNLWFLRVGWPAARIALRAGGRRAAVTALDDWIVKSKTYHVNEQSTATMRRALRDAGFAGIRTWIDPDVLRSGGHQLTAGLGGGRGVRLAARLAASPPLRAILGNDVYGLARRAAG